MEEPMNLIEEKRDERLCGVCRQRELFILCDGCKIPVCIECLKYGMYGTGCGNIQPLYLCRDCYDDPGINTG